MSELFETAKNILHRSIVKRQAELDDLFAAYEKLGGTYVDETAGAEPAQEVKRLTGAKASAVKKQRRKKEKPATAAMAEDEVEIMLQSKKLIVTGRQALAIEKMRLKGDVVGIDDLSGLYGGSKSRFYQDVEDLRARLAKVGMELVNIRGLGYKLEKAA